MKQKRIDPSLLLIILMVLVAIVFIVLLVFQVRKDRITQFAEVNPSIPILFTLSQDNKPLVSQIVLVQNESKRLGIFEIPYNMGLILGELGRVDRVSAIFEEQGAEAFRNHLEGFYDREIPFRFNLSLDGLVEVSDLLGGIPLEIEDAIDVQEEGRFIRIPNGDVVLDGQKVVPFLEYIGIGEAPGDRADRQFAFSQGFFQRLGNQVSILGTPEAEPILSAKLDSNLDLDNFLNLITLFQDLDYDSVITQRILGTERIVQTPEGEIPLLFPHFEGQLARDSFQQTVTALALSPNLETDLSILRIEILNGTLVPRLAQRTRDLLSNYGVQVISFGNAEDQDTEFTQVIYHTSEEAGQKIAELIRGQRLIPGSGTNPEMADVTVILGRDFDGWYVREGR